MFNMQYSQGCILPLTIVVSLHKAELRHYSGWQNTICPEEFNLIVPLEAAPAHPYKIQHRLNLE
jgi:hypothetical protein